jgi:hypothetical protein
MERAKRAQNFAREFAFQGAFLGPRGVDCWGHETFWLSTPWQLAWVLVIFPQERAEVTKTWSKRKLGLS